MGKYTSQREVEVCGGFDRQSRSEIANAKHKNKGKKENNKKVLKVTLG